MSIIVGDHCWRVAWGWVSSQIRVAELKLLPPRAPGDNFLACHLCNQLQMDAFFFPHLHDERAAASRAGERLVGVTYSLVLT